MIHERNIWVIGGDQRQVQLSGQLAADGHTVRTFALERAEEPMDGVEQAGGLEGVERARLAWCSPCRC